MYLGKMTQVAVMALGVTLVGCNSQPTKDMVAAPVVTEPSLPDWVLNPTVEDGIASTDCVKYSGNMSVDRKLAIANARADIAQQINTRVSAMDKTYARRVDSAEAQSIGSTFESVSKQVAQQHLSGARPIKVDIITFDGTKQLCSMVALGASTRDLFDNIVASSGKKLSAQNESILYEEFKAHKAQDELEQEIQKQTN